MKFFYFLSLFLFFVNISYAQPWIKNLPQDKAKTNLTFFDYQRAFNEYWAPYHVDKGYYVENGIRKKAPGWKQFKRWEYEKESQINPETGKFPEKPAREIDKVLTYSSEKSPSTANWTCLGSNNSAGGYAGIGRINCIAFHPSNHNTYWAGTASGGIWVTTDNGSNWTCLTNNLDALAVSDIVIPTDYTTTNTIYIATGDKDHWDNRSIGVLKSTDGGSTWNPTGISYTLADNKMVNRILLDPNNNQILIAATTNGVLKTTNGGSTWNTLLTTTNFIDMEYKPGDFNTLYGSTTNGTIYVSSNGGSNWTQAFNNASAYRIELAVSSHQDSWVYALAVNSSSGLYGIFQSINSGASFSQVFSGSTLNLLGWNSNGMDSGGQGWYDLSLSVSPANANTLLVGGVNTWRSTNGGTSWAIVNHWWGDGVPAVHADKHKLEYRNNGDLFECNDGGIYFSNDNGTNWIDKTNGMVISQMYKLGVSQIVPDETITGLQDNGTKLFTGGNWEDVKGGDGMECLIDYTDVNIQYGTYVYGQIDRTTNHWSSATAIEPSGAGNGAWVTPYIIDPNDPQILYAGYADVWKTFNRGNSWTQISTMSTSDKIRSMAIAPSNTQVLYVASPTKIWKTTNGGTSWTEITGSLPIATGNITSIAIKNNDDTKLWVTMSGYNANKVFQSDNSGTSWTNISNGLPSIPAYSIVQNKQATSEEQLYVGTELGVFFKKGSDPWLAYNTGLPSVKIGEIEIYYHSNPQNSILRAATYGRGLWETPVYSSCTPPPPPVVGTITQPTCTLATGSVDLSGLPSTGTWTINPGGIIGTGSSTTISGLMPGTYYFTVIDGNTGCESQPSSAVVINPQPETPPAPVITINNFILVSNTPYGNQWYNQDGIINGAINPTYTVSSNGNYYDIVTLNGCSSPPSNIIYVTNVGIDPAGSITTVSIYPNPFRNELIIETIGLQEEITFEILNSLGQIVFKGSFKEKTIIPTTGLVSGTYLVRLTKGGERAMIRIMKE